MSQDDMRKLATEALRERGLPESALEELFTVYDLLLDAEGKPLGVSLSKAGPFVFFHAAAEAGNGRKGPPRPLQAIAVQASPARVWNRDAQGFRAYVEAYDYARNPQRLPAKAVFSAWYMITYGAVPSIVQRATGYEPAVTARVSAPATVIKDGVATTTAWTETPGMRNLAEHVIRVLENGQVEAESRPAVGESHKFPAQP
jgi:hypothetical protein